MISEATESSARARGREFILLIAAWVTLGMIMALLARQNLSVPGLYYDEAVFAGMAKDFVTGHVHGHHMPDHQIITLAGRPFPLFVQTYLGALKSWMLFPAFSSFGPSVATLRATNLFWELIALLFLASATQPALERAMQSVPRINWSLRATNLFWELIALLFLMLAAWRWLGL